MKFWMRPLRICKLRLESCRAEPASNPLVILIVEGVGLEIVPVDIEHDLKSSPITYWAEGDLIWNEGVLLYGTDSGTAERLVDPPSINGHAALRVMLLYKCRQRTKLVGLTAPPEVLRRRAIGLDILEKPVLSFDHT